MQGLENEQNIENYSYKGKNLLQQVPNVPKKTAKKIIKNKVTTSVD